VPRSISGTRCTSRSSRTDAVKRRAHPPSFAPLFAVALAVALVASAPVHGADDPVSAAMKLYEKRRYEQAARMLEDARLEAERRGRPRERPVGAARRKRGARHVGRYGRSGGDRAGASRGPGRRSARGRKIPAARSRRGDPRTRAVAALATLPHRDLYRDRRAG